MKKRIFLNVPKYIPVNKLEKMRKYYRDRGFLVNDPFKVEEYLNQIRVTMNKDFNEGNVIAKSLEALTDSDIVICSSHWMKDKNCKLLLHFAYLGNKPTYQEYSDRRINMVSSLKPNPKVISTYKDDYILTSNLEEVNEPE